MMNLHDPSVQLHLTSAICGSIAVVATLIRVYVRRLVLWFDDGCALLSMVSVIAQMVVILTTTLPSHPGIYYALVATVFYCAVWFARLSILMTIVRLDPGNRNRFLSAVVVVFLLMLCILIGQAFWVCGQRRMVEGRLQRACLPTNQIAIFKLVTDVIADFTLLTSSLRLFLILRDKALRFRLSCLFGTCVITTILSLVNCSLIFGGETPLKVILVSLVETCVSLFVANVPALFSAISVTENTAHRASRVGVVSSIRFIHHITDTQISGNLIETTQVPVTIIKTSPDDIERHRCDPDASPVSSFKTEKLGAVQPA